MIYLLDTNIVSYIIKAQDTILIDKFEQAAKTATIGVSSITTAELYYGVKKKNSQKLKQAVDAFLSPLQVFEFDQSASAVYALSKTPDAQLAKETLMNAIRKHNPDTRKLMFHSDQGVQYSAKLFTNTLRMLKITQSMSRRGNCWDNAVMERFFRSLKGERLDYLSFINHEAVVPVVASYIRFYNYKRISSVLNYQTPAKRREILKKAA